MARHRTQVLLTGFGPFPDVAENATQWVVPLIAQAAKRAFPSLNVTSAILRTEWQFAPLEAQRLTVELKPKVVIHFGVSGRARGFEIETVGKNQTMPHADACGAMPEETCLDSDGPLHISARWPAALIVSRLRARGLPARISRHAGHYICNAVLYRSLTLAKTSAAPALTGFVHIPDATGSTTSRRSGARHIGLSEGDAVRGGLEIIAACLRLPPVSEFQAIERTRQRSAFSDIAHIGTAPVVERRRR